MIIDTVKNISQYTELHPDLPKVLQQIAAIDPLTSEAGRYDVPESEAFFMIQKYETKDVSEGVWEAHRKFIDVQYVVSRQRLLTKLLSLPPRRSRPQHLLQFVIQFGQWDVASHHLALFVDQYHRGHGEDAELVGRPAVEPATFVAKSLSYLLFCIRDGRARCAH